MTFDDPVLHDELRRIVAERPGLSAAAVDSASKLSPDLVTTVAALREMVRQGQLQKVQGLHYKAGIEVKPRPLAQATETTIAGEQNSGPVPPDQAGSNPAARSNQTASCEKLGRREGTIKQRVYLALTRPMTNREVSVATGFNLKKTADNLCFLKYDGRIRQRFIDGVKYWEHIETSASDRRPPITGVLPERPVDSIAIAADVLSEINAERGRQITKGFNAAWDDTKTPESWCNDIEAYIVWARQMHRMRSPNKYLRRMLQVAALAIAACESFDRTVYQRAE